MNQLPLYAIDNGLENALSMARAARLAYSEKADIQRQVNDWGFSKFYFLNFQGTQGYVAGREDTVVVAFRGTEAKNLKDWLTNLQFHRVTAYNGEVHEGFLEAFNWVWPELAPIVQTFRDRNQALLITGHSLGGALATLAASQLHSIQKTVTGLYTFGSPRVGNRAFSEQFNAALYDRTFRFVNDEDIVPCVPLRAMGYLHVGQLLYFDAIGQLQRSSNSADTRPDLIGQDSGQLFLGDLEPIQDHDIAVYEDWVSKVSGAAQPVAAKVASPMT